MGSRPIKTRSERKQRQVNILGVVLATALPLVLVVLLVTADLKQDLSEWNAIPGASRNGVPVISWKALALDDNRSSDAVLRRGLRDGAPVSMLGYMMDGAQPVQNGVPVSIFFLMPAAGFWLHPAHREPDEMVSVDLLPRTTVPFIHRRLVWVTGRFRHLQTTLQDGQPLYAIETAYVEEASERNLIHWFRP